MEDEIKSPQSTPMPDALGSLLSNPALLKGIADALGSVQTNSSGTTTEAGNTPSTPTALVGDGLGALLSNPAVLEKLPQIMATLKPLMALPPPTAAPSSAPPAPEICREQLLQALKPFLSRERCEAIDTILRLSKLGLIFGQLK